MQYILGLDLGTTGNRAILFNAEAAIVGQAYRELTQYYPQPGYLEHDPEEIWRDTCTCIQQVIEETGIAANAIAAIGLSVQRETCLLWDKTTGKPLHKAIVWQDRRTASMCRQLQARGQVETIQERTGLIVDAYFSATKFAWLLDWVRTHNFNFDINNILAGTIDTWILWKLTGGKVHATDHSNASRTMLMNLAQGSWDSQLLDLFQIPDRIMPQIQPSLGSFGTTDPQLFEEAIPITAVFGDQQAALFAHGCDRPGMVKCTYGTGCFLIAHTGETIARSHHQLLSTVAWTQLANGKTATSYALEAAMFTTGACIQWLRDGLKLINSAAETEQLARQVADNNGVYFVPALSGLGAPRWDMNARGAFMGITGGVQREHMVRAVLEAIAYQVKDAIEAMNQDSTPIEILKVDGGACQNDFLMQFQADALGIPIERPVVLEATAQGAAFGAGLAIGYWTNYQQLCQSRKIDRIFEPGTGAIPAQNNFITWLKAVNRAQHWVDNETNETEDRYSSSAIESNQLGVKL